MLRLVLFRSFLLFLLHTFKGCIGSGNDCIWVCFFLLKKRDRKRILNFFHYDLNFMLFTTQIFCKCCFIEFIFFFAFVCNTDRERACPWKMCPYVIYYTCSTHVDNTFKQPNKHTLITFISVLVPLSCYVLNALFVTPPA